MSSSLGVSFREQVQQDLSKYEVFLKDPHHLTYKESFYIKAKQGEAYVESLIHKDTLENRINICKYLKQFLSDLNDDKLLLAYCEAYGTIAYGATGESELDKHMTDNINHIALNHFAFNLSNTQNTKQELFFTLFQSTIKNDYNKDAAAEAYSSTKAAAIAGASMLYPTWITSLAGTWQLLTQNRSSQSSSSSQATQGGISTALGTERQTDFLFPEIRQRALSGALVDDVVQQPIAIVVLLARSTAQLTIQEIMANKQSLQNMSAPAKAQKIFDYFKKSLQTANSHYHPISIVAAPVPAQGATPLASLVTPGASGSSMDHSQAPAQEQRAANRAMQRATASLRSQKTRDSVRSRRTITDMKAQRGESGAILQKAIVSTKPQRTKSSATSQRIITSLGAKKVGISRISLRGVKK